MSARPSGRGATIDWADARRRLATSAAATGEGPSPERARAILDERARALARRPDPGAGPGAEVEVLILRLGTERYALDTRYVRQVVRAPHLTAVPGRGDGLRGVINLNGEVLAVFDLHAALGVEARGRGDGDRVVVLGEGRDEFGVGVDAASEVTRLRLDEVLDPPAATAGRRLLRGVTPDLLGLIDGAELLGDGQFLIGGAD